MRVDGHARKAKVGAWEHSVPAKAKPVVEQMKEVMETPRWLERAGFAGLGAAGVGVLWGFSHRRTRNRRAGMK